MKRFEEVLEAVRDYPVRTVAVAVAHDETVIQAVKDAAEGGIAEAILVGDRDEIMRLAEKVGLEVNDKDVIHERDDVRAAHRAVTMVKEGQADIVMKGHLHTDDFLRAVLNREHGLRVSGVVMSHVFVVEMPGLDKFLFITDSAMNIAPDLERKAAILLNAVHLANAFGLEEPRVACLAAVELLNPAMPATVDATCLAKMGDRRQFSPRCIVDGPFALDNAISALAAKHKRISGPVAGRADILLCPDIEAGNMLAKSLVYFAKCRLAGTLVGARAPVVLTSRADSAESKMLSIATAVYLCNVERRLRLKVGKVHY